MDNQLQTERNEESRMVYRSVWPRRFNNDLLFENWQWELRESDEDGNVKTWDYSFDDVRQFVQREAMVPDDRFPGLPVQFRPSDVFYELPIDLSKEIAFVMKNERSFPVTHPDGELTEFRVEGWTLVEIFEEGPEGKLLRCPYSTIERDVYLFESNQGYSPGWLLIRGGRLRKAIPMSITQVAECIMSSGLYLPERVQKSLEAGPLTGVQFAGPRMQGPDIAGDFPQADAREKAIPPSSLHDSPDDVKPAENARESTSPLSRPDDESDNAASCGLVVGEDGRCVNWNGTLYSFGPRQGIAVRMLYEAWRKGVPDVGGDAILEAVDHASPPRSVSALFQPKSGNRKEERAAFGSLIVEGGTKGSYRLSPPCERNHRDDL